MTRDECIQQQRHTYLLGHDQEWIQFWPCGVKSYHPDDIRERFCGRCHQFIKDVRDMEKRRDEGDALKAQVSHESTCFRRTNLSQA